MDKRRLAVNVPQHTYDAIEELAREKATNRTVVINTLLAHALKDHSAELDISLDEAVQAETERRRGIGVHAMDIRYGRTTN